MRRWAIGLMYGMLGLLAWAGDIVVEMTGFQSDGGLALVSLFDSAGGYPMEHGQAARSAQATISNGVARVLFSEVLPGDYAVAVCHDVNGNGQMDTTWYGRPKEGYGASNNPAPRRRPPRFDEARFSAGSNTVEVLITITYVGHQQ